MRVNLCIHTQWTQQSEGNIHIQCSQATFTFNALLSLLSLHVVKATSTFNARLLSPLH